jgi:hypothetical protein
MTAEAEPGTAMAGMRERAGRPGKAGKAGKEGIAHWRLRLWKEEQRRSRAPGSAEAVPQ